MLQHVGRALRALRPTSTAAWRPRVRFNSQVRHCDVYCARLFNLFSSDPVFHLLLVFTLVLPSAVDARARRRQAIAPVACQPRLDCACCFQSRRSGTRRFVGIGFERPPHRRAAVRTAYRAVCCAARRGRDRPKADRAGRQAETSVLMRTFLRDSSFKDHDSFSFSSYLRPV